MADTFEVTCKALYGLRKRFGDELKLYDPATMHFSWIVEFPMFAWDEEDKHLGRHAPSVHRAAAAGPAAAGDRSRQVPAQAYDLVINGSEAGGGTIRIHDPEVQSRVFELLGIDREQARERFGFLLDALAYGAPPHGGIALGIDRWVMLLRRTGQHPRLHRVSQNAKGHRPDDRSSRLGGSAATARTGHPTPPPGRCDPPLTPGDQPARLNTRCGGSPARKSAARQAADWQVTPLASLSGTLNGGTFSQLDRWGDFVLSLRRKSNRAWGMPASKSPALVLVVVLSGCNSNSNSGPPPAAAPKTGRMRSPDKQGDKSAAGDKSATNAPAAGAGDGAERAQEEPDGHAVAVAPPADRGQANPAAPARPEPKGSAAVDKIDELDTLARVMPAVQLTERDAKSCLVRVGDKFPDVRLPNAAGEEQSLQKLFGRQLTVVCFWRAELPYAKEELGDLQHFVADRFPAAKLKVVGIDVRDTPEAAAAAVAAEKARFPNLLDADGECWPKWPTAACRAPTWSTPTGKCCGSTWNTCAALRRDLLRAIRATLANNP